MLDAVRKRSLPFLFSLAVACAALTSTADAQSLDKGWWVVIGSMPASDTNRMKSDLAHFTATAARCGFKSFNDFSDKFKGFEPGYNVFVVGAYPSQAAAQQARSALRPCVPDAYVKYAEYLGE